MTSDERLTAIEQRLTVTEEKLKLIEEAIVGNASDIITLSQYIQILEKKIAASEEVRPKCNGEGK